MYTFVPILSGGMGLGFASSPACPRYFYRLCLGLRYKGKKPLILKRGVRFALLILCWHLVLLVSVRRVWCIRHAIVFCMRTFFSLLRMGTLPDIC